MKVKKRFLLMLCIFTIAFPAAVSAQSLSPEVLAEDTSPGIQPRVNETGYKYKIIAGKRYKRLWSYTYNRWEEPTWTPA